MTHPSGRHSLAQPTSALGSVLQVAFWTPLLASCGAPDDRTRRTRPGSAQTQLGALAANSNWRVLIVDLDAQGNLGRDLGYYDDDANDHDSSLATAIVTRAPPTPLREVRPGLDVAPAGRETPTAEAAIVARRTNDLRALELLGDVLDPLAPPLYVAQVELSLRPATVKHIEADLREFGTWLSAAHDVASCADLQRGHIDDYKTWVAVKPGRYTAKPLSRTSIKNRLINLQCFFDRITEWGYPDPPQRPLIFAGDLPIVDKPLHGPSTTRRPPSS